jgi:hypothetical protein
MEDQIPEEFRDRIGYGLHGGTEQFYIKGVDGTLAQLGGKLPDPDRLKNWIAGADREHKKLVKHHEGRAR